MPHHSKQYRLCFLDSDERYFKEEIVEADDDLAAMIQAQTKLDKFTIELWTEDRMIARLEPDPLRKNIRIF